MRLILVPLVFLLVLTALPSSSDAVTPVNPVSDVVHTPVHADDIMSLNRAEVEARIGRKLKLKERIGIFIMKKKLMRITQEPPSDGELRKKDGLAIASLVCGICSLIAFGLIFGILAIIFGLIASNRIAKNPTRLKGAGTARWGMILGSIGIFAVIVLLSRMM